MSLKGTKTESNLQHAFAGESQANRRYLYFAQKADIEGYPEVAGLFKNVADGETGHAHGHLEYLATLGSGDPATGMAIGSTEDNLKSSVAGETYEYTEMYPNFRHLAEQEGNAAAVKEIDEQIEESKEHASRFQQTLAKAAKRFAALAKVEEKHANHYKATLAKVRV